MTKPSMSDKPSAPREWSENLIQDVNGVWYIREQHHAEKLFKAQRDVEGLQCALEAEKQARVEAEKRIELILDVVRSMRGREIPVGAFDTVIWPQIEKAGGK